jgi:iron complex outermembrane receptor protein
MCHHHLLPGAALRGAALRAALTLGATASLCAHARDASAQASAPSVTPPSVVQHVDAVYPQSALARREHADVLLTLTVDVDGHVSKVEVVTSGGADLDEAAVSAARQWLFEPARRNGLAVASRIRVPFHFAPPAPPPELVQPSPPEDQVAPMQAVPQETTPAPNAPASNGAGAEEVVVVGRRQPISRGASDFNVEVGQLAQVAQGNPHGNASDMLKLAAPGLLLTNEGGEGHAEQVFLRGFDAREGQDIEFTVGGVPINESGNLHGNGYADTHFIIPELIERLRVLEGPFDPRQGNYAVAGSADYGLGLEQRGLTAKVTAGSWGTERGLLTWGPANESRHTFAAVEIYKTDGFGQNRDAQRATAMGQYEGKLGSKGSWRLTTQAYSTHFHTAGVIREDDYAAGKIGFYDSYDQSSFARAQVPQGGDSSRYSIAADVETRSGDTTLTQQVFLIKRDMRLLEDFTGFLLDVQQPLQSLHPQRGDELDLNANELTLGAKGSARWETKVLGEKQEVEFGYFARGDQVSGTQQRLEATTGVPYQTDTDLTSQLADIGLYGDANLRVNSWIAARGGVRADLFDYNVLDNCAAHSVAHPSLTNPPTDQSCLSQQDYGRPREPNQRSSTASTAVLPKGTILFGPFEHLTFSASYGQGVRSIDPSYITQDVKTPFASIVSYEAGASYAHNIGNWDVTARSILFQTHVDKDLIFSESEGRNVLGVGTTRSGWVGAARITGAFLDESANITLVRSSYDDTHLLVAYVPDVVFRSDTALFRDLPLSIAGSKVKAALGSGITYVGPRALPYGQRSSDIFTLDVSATLTWKNFAVNVVSTNLLDTKYRSGEYNFASDFHGQNIQSPGQPTFTPQPTLVPERLFTAGAPRGIFGSLSVNLGGS